MKGSVPDTDQRLVSALVDLSEADDDYWTFRRGAERRQAHGLTQYPAMMVPSMQAALLGVVLDADTEVGSVWDPFAGAGTTLVESMRLGVNYEGQDINPLAVLFCKAKAGPFHTNRLRDGARRTIERASADRSCKVEANFPGLEKWFGREVARELSRIRRAIRDEPSLWCRRVMWSTLAETVRLSSNSRTSTFKLHIRSEEDLASREVAPLDTFSSLLYDVVDRLAEEAVALRTAGHLSQNGFYRGEITIHLGDSSQEAVGSRQHDLLITSPPYGDNKSTVPYGQYSYLPLQWIDLADIDESTDDTYLRSTYEIDTRSLGGGRRGATTEIKPLLPSSPTLATTLTRLEDSPPDRASRVAAYFRDLDACLGPVIEGLRRGAYMVWTIGNRQVGGKRVPTDTILTELLAARGGRFVSGVERCIPSKRMATRNNIAATMRRENILVFRKADCESHG